MSRGLKIKIKKCIQANDLSKVMKLLESQDNVDGAAREAVGVAIELGDEALAERFVPLITPISWMTYPLIQASRAGMTSLVEKLVELCDAEDVDALCAAAEGGHVETVKVLMRRADPRGQDSRALLEAARGGHTDVVFQLIPFSRPKARDSQALIEACRLGHTEIVKQLLPFSSKIQCALHGFAPACKHNHQGVVEVLLEASLPDPEDTYLLGLNAAASEGHADLVRTLAWATVSTNRMPTHFASESLIEAASLGHTGVVEALVQFVDRHSGAFEEALHAALGADHDEAVGLLVRRANLEATRDLINDDCLEAKLDEAVTRWQAKRQHQALQANEYARRRQDGEGGAVAEETPAQPRSPRL